MITVITTSCNNHKCDDTIYSRTALIQHANGSKSIVVHAEGKNSNTILLRFDSTGALMDIIRDLRDSTRQHFIFYRETGSLFGHGRISLDTQKIGEWDYYFDSSATLQGRYYYFNNIPSGYVTLYHNHFGPVSDSILYNIYGHRRKRQYYPDTR